MLGTMSLFFSSRRRHTRCSRDWSSDVCSSDLRQGGEKRTVTVRLARAPSEADSEVAAANSKAKGEAASSKEEMLGISVEPLTQDDARDPRLRPVVQRGGGLIVTDVSPDGPAYQRLLAADDGGPDIIVAVNGAPTRTRAALRE